MNTITEEQWYNHPSFRKELATLLDHPTLKIALSIVLDKGFKATPLISGGDLIHIFALMGAKKDGYREALINLEALSKVKPTPPPEQRAWENTAKRKPPGDDDRTSAP